MFANVIMLVGISAAVVPLVLHLLSRARHREVNWGAMMFLQGADVRHRRVAKATQFLLLLVRMGLVALLAVALARPIIQGRMAKASPGGHVTAVLLLDCSASMAYDENGRTRFQMAQAAARQVLRGLKAGDRASLILMGLPQSDTELEPTIDLRALEARIDDAKVSYARANLRDALARAADLLDRYERTNRDLYVICDHQALSWREVNDRFIADWQKRLRESSSGDAKSVERETRMFVIPVGTADADNVSIQEVRLPDAPAIFYRRADGTPAPINFEVTIHNYSSLQRVGIPLSVQSGSFHSPEQKINLPPNASVSVTVPVPFERAGSYVVSAQIKTSGYAADDHLETVVDVLAPIRVLILSGDERLGALSSESDFLRFALAPHASARSEPGHPSLKDPDPFDLTILPSEKWTSVDFDRYRVVVLANIERFTPTEAKALERYVYAGGQLLIAPGSLSRFDDYNNLLYRDGAGILPAELDAPTPADDSQSTVLLSWDTSHPIFAFLHGQYEAPAASIGRYFPARPRQVDANPIAWYLTGDPFLIEGHSERGRVLLMTTSLDADWTNFPLSNFYVPFMHSVVRYLAQGRVAGGNLFPGQPIRMTFADPNPNRSITLTRPDGKTEKLDELRLGQETEIRYPETEQPGEYQLKIEQPGSAPTVRSFIVRPAREESDLTPLSEERWSRLAAGLGFERVDPSARPLRDILATGREGRELWLLLLLAVFALFVLEMAIERIAIAPPVPARVGTRS